MDEKKKYLQLFSSVIEALSGLNKERKCWRLVGSTLVERTVGEVLPAVQKNSEMVTMIT